MPPKGRICGRLVAKRRTHLGNTPALRCAKPSSWSLCWRKQLFRRLGSSKSITRRAATQISSRTSSRPKRWVPPRGSPKSTRRALLKRREAARSTAPERILSERRALRGHQSTLRRRSYLKDEGPDRPNRSRSPGGESRRGCSASEGTTTSDVRTHELPVREVPRKVSQKPQKMPRR